MIAKKSKKADLEKKRFAFFQIGLIVSGAMCLAAFEYSSVEKAPEEEIVFNDFQNNIPIDLVQEIKEQPVSQPKSQPKMINLSQDITVTKEPVKEVKGVVTSKNIISIDDGDMDDDGGWEGIGFLPEEEPIIDVPDEEPEFPGGEAAMARFIQENFEMPDYMMDYEQGTVYVQFVVNKNGSIEQVEIRRGISDGLDAASKEVVKKMPRWKPGKNAGKPVRVRFTLPIMVKR